MSVLILGFLASLQEEPELPSPFTEVHVELKADVWFASFDGSGRLNQWFGNERDTEKKAPRFSFDHEGQLGGTEPSPGGELQMLWENSRHQYRGFGIGFRQAVWSESGSVDRNFTVDGTLVPAGSPFRSRLMKYTSTAHYVAGVRLEGVPVEVRGWAGCLFHQERFRMETSSGDLKDGAGGINLDLGGRVEVRPLPFLFAAAEGAASIAFGLPEVRAEISGGAVWGFVRLEGGYRYLWAASAIDPIFRISIAGPFVGVAIRF